MATPSVWRSRPRRRASVSTARRSLVPSTSTTPYSCIPASDQVDDRVADLAAGDDEAHAAEPKCPRTGPQDRLRGLRPPALAALFGRVPGTVPGTRPSGRVLL